MESINLFDCNCMFGPWKEDKGETFSSLEELHIYMNKYSIDKILVNHSLSKFFNPQTGNKLLSDTVKGESNIKQCWILLPESLELMEQTGGFIDSLKSNNVSGIRLFPKLHGYCFKEWIMYDLLKLLEKIKMPVFVDCCLEHWDDKFDWQEIYDICMSFPDLPVILVRMGIGSNRNLYPLLKKFDNLYFETSYYQVNRGIEYTVKKFGAGRMLFGTGAPVYESGCVISMLYFADISNEDKTLIAGENMSSLIRRIDYIGMG